MKNGLKQDLMILWLFSWRFLLGAFCGIVLVYLGYYVFMNLR